jgi:hypothetical protein
MCQFAVQRGRRRAQQGSAEFVPFKLCGFLFEEYAQLVIALFRPCVFEQWKSRRLSKAESLRYQLDCHAWQGQEPHLESPATLALWRLHARAERLAARLPP